MYIAIHLRILPTCLTGQFRHSLGAFRRRSHGALGLRGLKSQSNIVDKNSKISERFLNDSGGKRDEGELHCVIDSGLQFHNETTYIELNTRRRLMLSNLLGLKELARCMY